jgi:hypothetical protein
MKKEQLWPYFFNMFANQDQFVVYQVEEEKKDSPKSILSCFFFVSIDKSNYCKTCLLECRTNAIIGFIILFSMAQRTTQTTGKSFRFVLIRILR